jgi:hypothetical protein
MRFHDPLVLRRNRHVANIPGFAQSSLVVFEPLDVLLDWV